ncbi:MAG: hypothetical protein NVS2B11_03430 [Acetobacteraceae bacterium]
MSHSQHQPLALQRAEQAAWVQVRDVMAAQFRLASAMASWWEQLFQQNLAATGQVIGKVVGQPLYEGNVQNITDKH